MRVDNQELTHYGVLGMKWGRRTGGSRSGSSGSKKVGSPDYERKNQLKGKRVKDMSNDELKEFTNRIQLETAYRKATTKPKSAGRKLVEGIVNDLAKQALKEVTKNASAAVMKKAMARAAR